ncbi:methyltransferase domain-containing protein [Herbaspirillum seropedicae]|uniref:SAM-dependent methyltransferase protein n=3 Tax=Herbaspirillum seropedicae TaxID=964 RepID=D8IVS9_HERSS|nr:class I SAM-dependent methyltransferase [Herbaspirillum seropedicae]ADJ65887.1 SAM-dependent methyltransferase protein [Herbaspirillum seropedicae SmR1]AON56769.1 SAM-dependent methyltransferase [Herbaspirillum seropedicae]MDR6397535.1 SAM-dependent methyltransferase [Herbaspirillum seropedicae]QDD66632.1 methyltransferase domain-containing protein [Herbaspirillum seropedicae]UMU23699.1 methyltransferase domain-containing protein [Herbaspirillum seropedicae]
MTAASFFIKPGYRARTQPEYYADVHDDGTIWQPEVYPLAATLARQYGCRYIIDIGCGRARKLSMMYPEFQIIGMDFGSNLEHCRAQYPFGNWVEVDLENSDGVQFPPEVLQNAVVINSDVIEHLVNPTRLMALIRSYLVHAKVAVISTPERDLERGTHDMGPPANPTHIREWNLAELETMLSSEGLRPAYCGLTISNDRDMLRKTSLAVVPGLSLNSSAVRELGAFCEKWLAASPEMRDAGNGQYLQNLAQLEREMASAQSAAQPLLAPMSPLEIGMEHIAAARYEEAFKVLTEALQNDGENPAVVFQLGRLAAICNMPEDAKELFYQAALRAPEIVKDIFDFYQEQLARARAGLE